MSNYTSGNSAPTLMAQMPNNKGNISKNTPKHESVSGGTSMTHFGKGSQGAPKASGNVFPVGNKVSVSTPKPYCGKIENDGYMNSDRNNFLK